MRSPESREECLVGNSKHTRLWLRWRATMSGDLNDLPFFNDLTAAAALPNDAACLSSAPSRAATGAGSGGRPDFASPQSVAARHNDRSGQASAFHGCTPFSDRRRWSRSVCAPSSAPPFFFFFQKCDDPLVRVVPVCKHRLPLPHARKAANEL